MSKSGMILPKMGNPVVANAYAIRTRRIPAFRSGEVTVESYGNHNQSLICVRNTPYPVSSYSISSRYCYTSPTMKKLMISMRKCIHPFTGQCPGRLKLLRARSALALVAQSSIWSLISPIACMNAYTVVGRGPTVDP